MHQQDVDGVWHHLVRDHSKVRLAIIDADQIKRVAAQSDGRSVLTQDVNALRGEQAGDGFFRFGNRLVVSEAAEYTIGRTQACEHLNHFFLRRGVPEEVVPRHQNHVGLQPVG
jgi:hypothetical protein